MPLYINEDKRIGDVGSVWNEYDLLQETDCKSIHEVLEKYELYELSIEEELHYEQTGKVNLW